MSTVIVCGAPWCALEKLFSFLNGAGVETPKSAASCVIPTIDSWHQSLFVQQSNAKASFLPSKAWQQALGEIFLANWEVPVWGWADSRSTFLLDFWREFDSQTRFVLIYVSPQEALAYAMQTLQEDQEFDPKKILEEWQYFSLEMQRFHMRNRSRCIMVNASAALYYPQVFIDAIASTLSIPLNNGHALKDQNDEVSHNPLASYLAQQIMQSFPALVTLASEIEASLLELGECDPNSGTSEIIAQFRQLISLQTQIPLLTSQHNELKTLSTEQQRKIDQLSKDKLVTIKERDQQINLAKEQLAHIKQIEKQQHNQQHEAELLLLQLHQVQEELEQHFLENQQLKLTNEEYALATMEKQTLLEQLEHQNLSLQHSYENQVHLTQEKQSQLAQAEQLFQRQQQEAELLLLQLHQVQEELEFYFLQLQEQKLENQTTQGRLQKVLRHYPEYAEWDSLTMTRSQVIDEAVYIYWRVEGFCCGERKFSTFEFATYMNNHNEPALLIDHVGSLPLIRWPLIAKNEPQIILQPAAVINKLNRSWLALQQLATSDWLVIKSLCRALEQVTQEKFLNDAMPVTTEYYRQQLAIFQTQWQQLPIAWRYDAVVIKREQVNPDYEHVWLVFENANYGNRHWSTFEFRLGAALISPENFSKYPKLEFPKMEQSELQFENWYPESEDDFGSKFELRLDLNKREMDMTAWRALTLQDQEQLIAILIALPNTIADFEEQGITLSRPWQDWLQLLQDLRLTIYEKLTA